MEIEATVYHWTQTGMRKGAALAGDTYIERSEVERLLEAAHRRGYEQGELAASDVRTKP